MRHDIEICYLGIEAPDPDLLRPLLSEVVGLMPGDRLPGGSLTWRNDDKVHRVIVAPGSRSDAAFIGFEASDRAAFDRVTRHLRSAGYEVAEGNSEDCADRRVQRLARTNAPWGVQVEIVLGLQTAPAPFAAPLMPGGFLTAGVGFGHTVFATTAFEESQRFLTAGLGLTQSDWLEMEIAAGIELEVRFFHCNERHHSIALAKAPVELPQKLHHFMVETNSRDDVGAAFDRAWGSGLAIPNGLGRHDNDGMFSFYVSSAVGFQVEVGHGAKVVTDGWEGNHRYEQISAWGHQPLRTG